MSNNRNPITITNHLNLGNSHQTAPKTSGTFYGGNSLVPNKKFMLSYMNARANEKEKIVNLFSRLFREFHFNKKEDKDLILRHIRKLYPSALYLSGKKIDNLLKAFATSNLNLVRGKILVNIPRLKEFVKGQKLSIKEAKLAGTGQRIMGNKPVFVKLVNYTDEKGSKSKLESTSNGKVVHLKTFNMPLRKSRKKARDNRSIFLMDNGSRGQSAKKSLPFYRLKRQS